MSNIKFSTAQDSDFDRIFDIIKNIRQTVFTKEQGANENEDVDEYDRSALFLLYYAGSNPAATARIAKTENGYKIGRIAVLKEYRGKGLGTEIVSTAIVKAFELSDEPVIYVDAQLHAVPFYKRLGFEIIGKRFIDRGLEHIPMSVTRENFDGKRQQKK